MDKKDAVNTDRQLLLAEQNRRHREIAAGSEVTMRDIAIARILSGELPEGAGGPN